MHSLLLTGDPLSSNGNAKHELVLQAADLAEAVRKALGRYMYVQHRLIALLLSLWLFLLPY